MMDVGKRRSDRQIDRRDDDRKKYKKMSRSRSWSRVNNPRFKKLNNKIKEKEKINKPIKKNVQFIDDSTLEKVKFFKINDEPNAQGVTKEELEQLKQKFQLEMQKNIKQYGSSLTGEQIKHQESLMEGQKRKETEKELQKKLQNNKEQIEWLFPAKLILSKDDQQVIRGSESIEKQLHTQRISTKLRAFYSSEILIPDEPFVDYDNAQKKNSQKKKQIITLIIPDFSQDIVEDVYMTQIQDSQHSIQELQDDKNNSKKKILFKPAKQSILKKSKEQIEKEKEEEKQKEIERKKKYKEEKEKRKQKEREEREEREKEKDRKSYSKNYKDKYSKKSSTNDNDEEENQQKEFKSPNIDPETLKKLINLIQNQSQNQQTSGTSNTEELQAIIKGLKDSGADVQNIVQNIEFLKGIMAKQSQQQQFMPNKPIQQNQFKKFNMKMHGKFKGNRNIITNSPGPNNQFKQQQPLINQLQFGIQQIASQNDNDQQQQPQQQFFNQQQQLSDQAIEFDKNSLNLSQQNSSNLQKFNNNAQNLEQQSSLNYEQGQIENNFNQIQPQQSQQFQSNFDNQINFQQSNKNLNFQNNNKVNQFQNQNNLQDQGAQNNFQPNEQFNPSIPQQNQQFLKKPQRPYRSKPCFYFNKPQGCPNGDSCNFKHEEANFNKQQQNPITQQQEFQQGSNLPQNQIFQNQNYQNQNFQNQNLQNQNSFNNVSYQQDGPQQNQNNNLNLINLQQNQVNVPQQQQIQQNSLQNNKNFRTQSPGLMNNNIQLEKNNSSQGQQINQINENNSNKVVPSQNIDRANAPSPSINAQNLNSPSLKQKKHFSTQPPQNNNNNNNQQNFQKNIKDQQQQKQMPQQQQMPQQMPQFNNMGFNPMQQGQNFAMMPPPPHMMAGMGGMGGMNNMGGMGGMFQPPQQFMFPHPPPHFMFFDPNAPRFPPTNPNQKFNQFQK